MDDQGNFEAQFRQMLVGNGGTHASNSGNAHTSHPTVRLPPASSYPLAPHQPRGFPPYVQNGHAHAPSPPLGQRASAQTMQFQGGLGLQPSPHRQQMRGPPGPQFAPPVPGSPHAPAGFYGRPPQQNLPPGQRARHQQHLPLDPNAFQRSGHGQPRGRGGQHQLFNPHQPRPIPMYSFGDQQERKVQYLQQLVSIEVGSVQMSQTERDEKDAFRQALQQVCNEVCDADPDRLPRVSLECFGSFKSGFATAGSDMDLVIVVKDSSSTSASLSLLEDDLPRALERKLLKLGYGSRLLTRTRVPIIKVCEKPGSSLLSKLRAERENWDLLRNELKYPHLHQNGDDEAGADASENVVAAVQETGTTCVNEGAFSAKQEKLAAPPSNAKAQSTADQSVLEKTPEEIDAENHKQEAANVQITKAGHIRPKRDDRTWMRERKAGPLDFPKSGVGIQSDINFFNPLGLHNTHLLYCYSLCDDRVQPMVLFVKSWAKRRKINSSYSGTLSSYGFVLMVLHYLVNIASPPVLPNLQGHGRPPGPYTPHDRGVDVDNWNVSFWRNSDEILSAKQRGQITSNREPLGSLVAGFFQYYSSQGGGPQFVWTQHILSLRSAGGILTKEEKGWTKAVTEEGEGKKIQHRYLFCIEDPFELDHNVARTVTHNGIVAIRDEFRRARRVLLAVGRGEVPHDGQLFDQLVEPEEVISIAHETSADGWTPDLDGAPDQPPRSEQIDRPAPAQANTRAPRASRKTPHTPTPPKPTALNTEDNDAFPSLGASSTKSSKRRSPHKHAPSSGEWSEISGDKAKAVLDEVKRKKDEAQAESTALGAAEAVLGDDW